MALSSLAVLYKHPHYSLSEFYHHLKINSARFKQLFPFSSPHSIIVTSTFCLYAFAILGASYK